MNKFLAAIGLLSALLLCGGCGGGESNSATAGGLTVRSGSLSKAAFIKRTDAICDRTKQRFEDRYVGLLKAARSTSFSEKKMLAVLVEVDLIPTYEGLIAQVRSLGAPRGDEAQITTFLGALQQDLNKAADQPSQAFKAGTPFGGASKVAKSYGLIGCSSSFA
jgi:hypothetical protein